MTFTGFSWLTKGAQWQNVNTATSIQFPQKDRDFLSAFCIYQLLTKVATKGLVYRTRSALEFRRFLIRISDYIMTDINSIRPRPLASKFSTVHHPLTNLTQQKSFSHRQRRKTKPQKRRCSKDFTMKAYLEWKN
jgi:hypothetical protein